MKHTKENIIKLLETIIEKKRYIASFFAEIEHFKDYKEYIGDINLINNIIKIIKYKRTFEEFCALYDVKGE